MSVRTPELEAEILQRISEGDTLRQICRDLTEKGTPITHGAVSKWAAADAEFAKRMYEARLQQMWAFADEIIEISDDISSDWLPGRKPNLEHIARSRLRVDSRKFLMMKVAARVFGDKIALTGEDGGQIQTRLVIKESGSE